MNAILFLLAATVGDTTGPLRCEFASVDRGEVRAGTVLSHTFALKNVGATAIRIADIEVGCGCLKPLATIRTVAPGAAAEIRVDVNTIAQPAGINQWKSTIRYVEVGNEAKPSYQLELIQRARIVREILVEPVAVHLSIDGETSHTITIRDQRDKPLAIAAARCAHPHVKTELTAVGVNAKGERIQQVHVTVRKDCPAGFHSDFVQLLSEDPAYRELRVPLTFLRKAPGQITATPEQLTLRLAEGEKAASGLIRLRDPDDKTVVVEKLEADHPALRMKWAAGPGSMATLRLGIESTEKLASGSGSVRVYIREPKPQILVIPVGWQSP